MKTITLDMWGYPVEVAYELTDDSIDILNWSFENEDIVDCLNLNDGHARDTFETDITTLIAAHEDRLIKDRQRLRSYHACKKNRERMYNL